MLKDWERVGVCNAYAYISTDVAVKMINKSKGIPIPSEGDF